MSTTKTFGSVLARIRKEQGFSSAHQFFKRVGGSRILGLAFISYWDMERGKKLPKSWRLKTILAALGIEQHSPKAQELVRAYFKALSGSDELLQLLSPQASDGADVSGGEPAEEAAHRMLERRSVNWTLEQWKLCAGNLVTHICNSFLFNTMGWVSVRELSDATGFKPEAVRRAYKVLAAGGLVNLSGDKARSPFADKVVQLPPVTPATAALKAALREKWNTWLEGSKCVDSKRMTVRMTRADLDIYRQHLEKAVNLAAAYDYIGENRRDSKIYLVDANIFQILPRE